MQSMQGINWEKVQRLVDMVTCEPAIRSCIERLITDCVPPVVRIKENNKPLAADLQRKYGPHLSDFCKNAVEMIHTCGFVAFTIKRRDNIPYAVTLPLGSFIWSVKEVTPQTKKRKHDGLALYYYDVNCVHSTTKNEDIHIIPFKEPRLGMCKFSPSPLDSLFEQHMNLKRLQIKHDLINTWNSTKHITTSERIDTPKDPTHESLRLLDEFRRYQLTGDHAAIRYSQQLMRSKEGSKLNATNGHMHWVTQVFSNDESEHIKTQVHALPPNTDVNEMSALTLSNSCEDALASFQQQVYLYFNMAMGTDVSNVNKNAQFIAKIEVQQMRGLVHFLQKLCILAYARAFDCEPDSVMCEMPLPSGMYMNTADDVKKLTESNMFTPGDQSKIRSAVMKSI
jgi:hypothetical protein